MSMTLVRTSVFAATLGSALMAVTLSTTAHAGILSVCVEGSPEIFNPQLSSNGTTSNVLANIYDNLVSVKATSSDIEPSLAESWTVSDDGRSYTFTLRKGVKWQSNAGFNPSRDFNADDVIFTFDRMMKADNPYAKINGGNYVTFNTKLADILESVKKIDDYTVTFTLKEPLAPFIGIMAHQSLAITSAEYADVLLKAGTPQAFDMQPIGTGPFALQAYQQDAMIRLIPFKETWGASIGDKSRTPMVDALIMAISTDASVRLQRALAGECQIALYPNLADREMIEKSDILDLRHTPVASTGFIDFNFRDEKFQDKRVRTALAEAINVPALVDAVYSGMGVATGALIPPVLWGHAKDLPPHEYNPEKAKELLKEAGYSDGFSTQVWAVPVYRPYMPNGRRAAEMIQADWAKIGVKAEIVTYEWGEYVQRARAGEAPVAMFGGIYDFPDPSQIPNNYFICDSEGKPSPSNVGGWCDKEFISLMNEAGRVSDKEKRIELYEKAQRRFHEEAPAVILGGADTLTTVSKNVKGFEPAIFGTSRFSGVTVE
jgi:dipeptide transport system substrate-binding protein